MVTPRHPLASIAMRILFAAAVLFLFCQCTTRTVTVKKSTVSFADDNDEDEMRSKFAEKGFSIGEDGSIVADNPDLYSGRTPKGFKGEVGNKMAKLGEKNQSLKEFDTPEYLRVQDFRSTRNPTKFERTAPESDSQFDMSRQVFKAETEDSSQFKKFAEKIIGIPTKESRFARKSFGDNAVTNAAVAEGVGQQAGYHANSDMSVDDVKKMLSPGVYAGRRGL